MFGLNIYAIYAMVAISLFCGGFVSGCQHEQSSQADHPEPGTASPREDPTAWSGSSECAPN